MLLPARQEDEKLSLGSQCAAAVPCGACSGADVCMSHCAIPQSGPAGPISWRRRRRAGRVSPHIFRRFRRGAAEGCAVDVKEFHYSLRPPHARTSPPHSAAAAPAPKQRACDAGGANAALLCAAFAQDDDTPGCRCNRAQFIAPAADDRLGGRLAAERGGRGGVHQATASITALSISRFRLRSTELSARRSAAAPPAACAGSE